MLRIPFFLDILTLEGEDITFPHNFWFQLHSDAHHIEQEWNPQLHCCKNFNTWNLYVTNITLSWLCNGVKGKKKSVLKNSWHSRRQQCIFWEYTMINSFEWHSSWWWTSTIPFHYKLYWWQWNYYAFFTVQKRSILCGHLVCLWSSICT